jgi:hypothetical protein
MGNSRVIEVDADTGEVLHGCMVYIPFRRKHPASTRFFMAFQDALIEIAKDDELTLEPKNVLLYLLGHLNFENFLHVSQTDIADALGMKKTNVSRAMRLLITKGIILDGPKVGRMKTYRLSHDLGWKGKVTSLDEYRRSRMKVIQGGKDADASSTSAASDKTA